MLNYGQIICWRPINSERQLNKSPRLDSETRPEMAPNQWICARDVQSHNLRHKGKDQQIKWEPWAQRNRHRGSRHSWSKDHLELFIRKDLEAMLQFCNSRHKQVKVSFFSWRLRLDAPLEGFISFLCFWRSKGWLRDSFRGQDTFPPQPKCPPGLIPLPEAREILPSDSFSWEMLPDSRAKYSACTWLPLRGRAPWEKSPLRVPWGPVESQISPYLQALSQESLPSFRGGIYRGISCGWSRKITGRKSWQIQAGEPIQTSSPNWGVVKTKVSVVLGLEMKLRTRPEVITGDNFKSQRRYSSLCCGKGEAWRRDGMSPRSRGT